MTAKHAVFSSMEPDSYPMDRVIGLVLAGGGGRRMGGKDKGLIALDGRPLVHWVVEALQPQCASLLISANRHQERYAELGWPVVADDKRLGLDSSTEPYQGPLAGIATALAQIKDWTQRQPQTPIKGVSGPAWLLVSPCDTPRIPTDLGPRLWAALQSQQARITIAADQERSHPLHALIPTDIGADLDDYLRCGGRSVLGWLARHQIATANIDQVPSPFLNLNRPADADDLMRAKLSLTR